MAWAHSNWWRLLEYPFSRSLHWLISTHLLGLNSSVSFSDQHPPHPTHAAGVQVLLSLTGDYLIASSTFSAPGTRLCISHILSLNPPAPLSALGVAGQGFLGAGAAPTGANLRKRSIWGGTQGVLGKPGLTKDCSQTRGRCRNPDISSPPHFLYSKVCHLHFSLWP